MPSVLVDADKDAHVAYFLSERSGCDIECQPVGVRLFSKLAVRRRRELPDIVHLHYLQYKMFVDGRPLLSAIKTAHFVIFLLFLRLRGVSFVWTAHNVESHEARSRLVDRVVRIYVANLCDTVVLLHEGMKPAVRRRLYCRTRMVVSPLGDYRKYHQARGDSDPVASVRFDRFNGPTIGMIGAVRRYKEIPLGIESAEHCDGGPLVQIAGNPRKEGLGEEIKSLAKDVPVPVSTDFRFLADSDIVYYNDSVDVVLILHSIEGVPASLNLAASSGVPVVATAGGAKASIVNQYDLGTVVEATPRAVAAGVDEVLDRDEATFGFEAFAADHRWEEYVQIHDEVYHALIPETTPRPN